MPLQSPHPFARTTLLGFGSFGRLAASHLTPHTSLTVVDPANTAPDAPTLENAIPGSNAVILAVPVQAIAEACRAIAPLLSPGTLVADVASVKIKPAKWMDELLPSHVSILATHPCFGPETVREVQTIAGQPIACCDVLRGGRGDANILASAREFLSSMLGLRVIDLTPDEHDKQMAYVQVLTHLVGHAAHELQLPELPTATLAYKYLLQMQHNTECDSDQLFEAIQHLNPHAADARARFGAAIDSVLAKAEPG